MIEEKVKSNRNRQHGSNIGDNSNNNDDNDDDDDRTCTTATAHGVVKGEYGTHTRCPDEDHEEIELCRKK
jgi:hypothetical protein